MSTDDVTQLARKQSFTDALIDPKALRCCDCNGWPLDNGAIFTAVFLIREGRAELGGICESCLLIRLQKRGRVINMTSSDCCQIDLPELDIHKVKHRRYR